MKYFTKAQIEEIRKALATLGVKDTDLDNAHELSGDELVAIIQDGVNKKVGIRKLIHDYLPDDIADGADGASAYDIWKSQPGNAGKSVAEFLASLKGADGRDGRDGVDGSSGSPGVPGTSAGFGTPTASVDTTASGQVGVSVSASGPNTAKVFNFTFHNLGSGGGGGEEAGRSIIGADPWFKLSSSATSIVPPALSIADPSSVAGGSWTMNGNTLSPTASLPYVWCFIQFTYDKALDNGYTYSRTGAYIVRRYTSGGGGSSDLDDITAMIDSIRSDMERAMAGYNSDLNALNTMLETIRTSIQTTITGNISDLNRRLSSIEGTDVETIAEEGLWGMLTTYYNQSGTAAQKSFAQIVLDSINAKATLQSGASFFDKTVGTGLTLNGLDGRISMCATRQDITDAIASATFDLDPAALSSILAKSQCGWEKDGALYQYDLYLVDFRTANPSGTLADYDTYMQTAAGSGGPAGDATRPAGPFAPIIVVNEFSAIKQTAEEISASVDSFRYMWQNGDTFKSYDEFEEDFEDRDSQYESYTYDQFVHDVLGYDKVAVGTALSNITQTAEGIRSTVGDVGYLWYRPKSGGGYEYEAFVVPADATRSAYIAAKQAAGWTLIDYGVNQSVIDQTSDEISLAVMKARLVWINSSLPGSNPAYCYEYEHWYNDWKSSGFSGTYEEYVETYYPSYVLTKAFNTPGDDTNLGTISRLKITESAIQSAVSDISTFGTAISAIDQTAREIKMGVGLTYKYWGNNAGDIKAYDDFKNDYESSGSQLSYETWVTGNKGYNLFEIPATTTVAGLAISSDKIWQGIGDGNGNIAAAITILKDLGVNSGKIILDASKVVVPGILSTNSDDGSYIEIDGGFITVFDSSGYERIIIGQGSDETSPVIKFYKTGPGTLTSRFLYDLGPNGIRWASDGSTYKRCRFSDRIVLGKLCPIYGHVTGVYSGGSAASTINGYYVFTPAGKIPSGGNAITHYYDFNMLQEGVTPWVAVANCWFNGFLVKTDKTARTRPAGASSEIEVWPLIEEGLYAVRPDDGWYMDNTGGFLSNYHGIVESDNVPSGGDEEEEE